MTLGALGYVGYGKETVEGDLATPTLFLPVSSFGFEDSDDDIIPAQIRASRDFSVSVPAPFPVSGNMEMELVPDKIAALLRSAFCATVVTTAGTAGDVGSYTHVFTPGSAVPTFAFEASKAGIHIIRYGGVKVDTFELKAAHGEIVTASFGLEGTNRASQASEVLAATVQTGMSVKTPFSFAGAEVKIGGTQLAHVKDVTFGVNNNLERIGTIRKTRAYKRMALGMREVNLGLTLDFTDKSEQDRFDAGAYFDVTLNFEADVIAATSKKYTLSIAIPKVKWNKVATPLAAGDFIEQAVEATILKPSGSNIFTATLINDETTVL